MAVITLTKENFEAEALKASVPVLVDFWASWCGPCRMLSPIVDEIAEEAGGSYKVGKVKGDEQRALAARVGGRGRGGDRGWGGGMGQRRSLPNTGFPDLAEYREYRAHHMACASTPRIGGGRGRR